MSSNFNILKSSGFLEWGSTLSKSERYGFITEKQYQKELLGTLDVFNE